MQLNLKINQLRKIFFLEKLLEKNHNELIKSSKLILKTQQGFMHMERAKTSICKREKTKSKNIYIKKEKWSTFTKKDIKKHNSNWLPNPDHPYKILITGDPGSGKRNSLFNLIVNGHILTKLIYMLKITMKQNINC